MKTSIVLSLTTAALVGAWATGYHRAHQRPTSPCAGGAASGAAGGAQGVDEPAGPPPQVWGGRSAGAVAAAAQFSADR